MSVTEFKAKCLEVFQRCVDGRVSSVTITRRGRRLGEYLPDKQDDVPLVPLFGCMRGSVIIPPGVDLTQPFFEGEIEAETADFDR